jgi:hypothetical protein
LDPPFFAAAFFLKVLTADGDYEGGKALPSNASGAGIFPRRPHSWR